jgi:S1-C subfamily serine protease
MRRLIAIFALALGMSAGIPLTLAHAANASPFIASGGYLGVALSDIDADRANVLKLREDRGVEVMLVEQGSPAEKAGIQTGDVLLSYNGEKILGVQQLGRLVRETPPGRKVGMEYWRDGKTGKLSLVIGSLEDHSSGVPPEFARMQGADAFNRLGFDVPNPVLLWRSSLLGVECEAVDSQLAEYFGVTRGVLVRFVLENSPAQKAGFKAGDVLTAVAGHPVATPRDVTASLRADRHGSATIPVDITRNRKGMTLHVVPPRYSN